MSDAAVSSCFPPAISALLSQTFSCPQFLDEEDFSPYLRWLLFSSDKAQLAAIRMLHRPLYSVSFTPEVLMKAGDSMQHS